MHDRDWMGGGSGRAAAPRRQWSVTVWLIVVCSGVFIADALLTPMLPPAWVFMEQRQVVGEVPPGGTLRETPIEPDRVQLANGRVVATDTATQRLIVSAGGREAVVAERSFVRIPALERWMYFSTSTALVTWSSDLGLRGLEFWRFITFQFSHANLNHLLFNMIALWFFGPIVEQALGRRRFLAFYLTCGVAGALLYLLLNAAGVGIHDLLGPDAKVPGVLINNPNTPLVGASAGIFGVLIAAARYVPNATVLLFFIIPMRLSTLAYGLVAVAVATVLLASLGISVPLLPIPTDNAGGEAAHLGGAMAGWYFARRPQKLADFFDVLGRLGPSRWWGARGGAHGEGGGSHPRAGDSRRAEVDRILAKIKDAGLSSLTEAERQTLRDASRP